MSNGYDTLENKKYYKENEAKEKYYKEHRSIISTVRKGSGMGRARGANGRFAILNRCSRKTLVRR